MEYDLSFFGEMFVRTFSFWWVIIPAIFLGLVVGAIPGFSAANTIIILLPLTLAMDPEIGLTFMVALYASSRMGAGIPAILVNIPGTAGAAATPLDGYPMTKQGRGQQAALQLPRQCLEYSLGLPEYQPPFERKHRGQP
jgi:putative tricarboxylic transport membrane protein